RTGGAGRDPEPLPGLGGRLRQDRARAHLDRARVGDAPRGRRLTREGGSPVKELEGKVAVITGAGSGMARAATRAFVREGARVLAADISGREQETAKEFGAAVVPFRCDVTQEAAVEAMFAAAREAFGRIDAVLNVAGIASAGLLKDVSMTDYERIMAVDL